MVKLFGWERHMNARVGAKRADELAVILRRKLLELASNNVKCVSHAPAITQGGR
jgi:hypothetical protein